MQFIQIVMYGSAIAVVVGGFVIGGFLLWRLLLGRLFPDAEVIALSPETHGSLPRDWPQPEAIPATWRKDAA